MIETMVTPVLENGCKVSVTGGYVRSKFDGCPAASWAQVLKRCGVFIVVHEIMEAQFVTEESTPRAYDKSRCRLRCGLCSAEKAGWVFVDRAHLCHMFVK